MEDAQVEELRRWAQGLTSDDRPEVKAAAKAILLLADDVEAARSQLLEERLIRGALEARQAQDDGTQPAEPDLHDEVGLDLAARLRAYVPRISRR